MKAMRKLVSKLIGRLARHKGVIDPRMNAELLRLAREMECVFVDTYSVFAVDGEMDDECTDDGLHLNVAGMMKWCNFLEQYM